MRGVKQEDDDVSESCSKVEFPGEVNNIVGKCSIQGITPLRLTAHTLFATWSCRGSRYQLLPITKDMSATFTTQFHDEPEGLASASPEQVTRSELGGSDDERRDTFDDGPDTNRPNDDGRRRMSVIPDTLPISASEEALIQAHINKQRRSSLLHLRRHSKAENHPHGHEHEHEEELAETEEERNEREQMNETAEADDEAVRKEIPDAVTLEAYGGKWEEWVGDGEGVGIERELPKGYAWDGMSIIEVTPCRVIHSIGGRS